MRSGSISIDHSGQPYIWIDLGASHHVTVEPNKVVLRESIRDCPELPWTDVRLFYAFGGKGDVIRLAVLEMAAFLKLKTEDVVP